MLVDSVNLIFNTCDMKKKKKYYYLFLKEAVKLQQLPVVNFISSTF